MLLSGRECSAGGADHAAWREDDDGGVVVELVGVCFSQGVFDRSQGGGGGVVVGFGDRASDGRQTEAVVGVGEGV